MRRTKLFLAVFAIFHSVVCTAGPLIYVVKPGDTSSTIAQKHVGEPIFTSDGSLSKLMSMNPHIKDPNLIYVGQVLTINPDHNETDANLKRELSSSSSVEEEKLKQPEQFPVSTAHKPTQEDTSALPISEPKEVSIQEPKKNPEFWLWLGTGMNFQYYKQSIPGINGEAIFQNIYGPTSFFRAGAQGETLGLDLSYKETPGRMLSSSSIAVTNGNYVWRTLSVEGLYRKNDDWNLRAGFQNHSMPFMSLDATTATVDVKNNILTMATLGFDKGFKFSERIRGEWQMRYQHPIISGSTDATPFSVSPKFAFDGSVGSIYSLGKNTRIGLYWYGQWHEYGFSYGRGSNAFTGNQTLFYSNVELRLGLEY